MLKNTFAQGVALIVAGILLGIIANGFASKQRRLFLNTYYPNALRVPPREPDRPLPPVNAALTPATATATVATATIVESPAPGQQPPVATDTTITAPPAGAVPSVATTTAPPAATTTAAPPPATATPAVPQGDPLARFTPHPDRASVEINGDDVMVLHKNGALFLDARRTAVFEEGHIAGSRSFSVWESDIDEKVNNLYAERNDPTQQNLPIVIYCSGGACEDSHMLAQKLWGIQFNNVYVYKDGYPDWQKRGGAVRKGAQP
ncbi:MAG TPA: rhodanese-like domain-containing protein [Thermoanaerobaculia bacterium]|nr:rhodanese-like domain-containing protein [Thermoanaerobaculia bacterium]